MSEVYSIKPGGRLLPVGFQSLPKYKVEKIINQISDQIPHDCMNTDSPILVEPKLCHDILDLIRATLEIDPAAWNWDAMHTAIDYYCKASQVDGSSKKMFR
jgi:hypothetical protein